MRTIGITNMEVQPWSENAVSSVSIAVSCGNDFTVSAVLEHADVEFWCESGLYDKSFYGQVDSPRGCQGSWFNYRTP